MTEKLKNKLLKRGFTKERILNSRGIINAAIDEALELKNREMANAISFAHNEGIKMACDEIEQSLPSDKDLCKYTILTDWHPKNSAKEVRDKIQEAINKLKG